MNYTIFLGILNLILLSRLRLIARDEGINSSDLWAMVIIPLLSLPFLTFSLSWVLLAVYLLVYPVLMWLLEKQTDKLNRNRMILLLVHVLAIGFLSSPVFTLSANGFSSDIITCIDAVLLPGSTFSTEMVYTAQLVLFGFLMVLNEANIVLRYLLKLVGLKSLGESKEVDQKEYNTGRVIGLLERIFVLLFVLLNQYAAIGFILAAKGVTRFKDFESRTFAEYVLIGTLLSALLAVAVAFVVKMAAFV